jgi:pilus assembly protein FimV
MRRVVSSIATGLLLGGSASTALGLGLGRGANSSTLGQPLNFSVQVHAEADELLTSECLGVEVFAGDVKLQPTAVKLSLEPGVNPSQATIRVATTSAVEEPVVTVTVGVGCPQRVTRRFVLFVDPPVLAFAPTVLPEPVPSPPARVEGPVDTAASPAIASAPTAAAQSTPSGRAGPATKGSAGARVVRERVAAASPSVRPVRKPVVARPAAKAAPVIAAARLKLDSLPAVPTPPAPAASAASAPVAAQAAASASASAEADLQAAQRVAAMEASLTRLQAEAKATRNSLEALQARLREAEAARTSNPLTWLLGLISAVLTLAVLTLLWLQSRGRREPAWWSAQAEPSPSAVAKPAPDELAETGPMRMTALAVDSGFSSSVLTRPMHEHFTVAAAAAVALPASTRREHAAAPARELSVEELIDLEQQADFFIVLGQDDAAIELLMGHVRSTGGASPMPYMKLLEIYRRRGDHASYERIRERFNRRFNAEVPGSDVDPQQGRSLEDYPEIVASLQAVWPVPARAAQQLDTWLSRGESDGPSFDLPAYSELLFLHVLARDIAERETRAGGIDVLLPFAGDDASSISPLVATMPFEAAPSSAASVFDLDLDLSVPESRAADSDGMSIEFISLGDDSHFRS